MVLKTKYVIKLLFKKKITIRAEYFVAQNVYIIYERRQIAFF